VSVDVLTEIVIDRPPTEVARFAAGPDNAPSWYVTSNARPGIAARDA